MGTNYYLHEETCPTCGRLFEPLHIGKSSAGWCFSLHVIPEEGIDTLDDWRTRWGTPDAIICNEYGDILSPDALEDIINDRCWKGEPPRRNEIDGERCIAHGENTYDLIVGEFS